MSFIPSSSFAWHLCTVIFLTKSSLVKIKSCKILWIDTQFHSTVPSLGSLYDKHPNWGWNWDYSVKLGIKHRVTLWITLLLKKYFLKDNFNVHDIQHCMVGTETTKSYALGMPLTSMWSHSPPLIPKLRVKLNIWHTIWYAIHA
jgi:hypothetical protein